MTTEEAIAKVRSQIAADWRRYGKPVASVFVPIAVVAALLHQNGEDPRVDGVWVLRCSEVCL